MHSAYMNHRPTVDAQAIAVGKGSKAAPMATRQYAQNLNNWCKCHPSPFRKKLSLGDSHDARAKAKLAWHMLKAGKLTKEAADLFRQRYHTYFEEFELR